MKPDTIGHHWTPSVRGYPVREGAKKHVFFKLMIYGVQWCPVASLQRSGADRMPKKRTGCGQDADRIGHYIYEKRGVFFGFGGSGQHGQHWTAFCESIYRLRDFVVTLDIRKGNDADFYTTF